MSGARLRRTSLALVVASVLLLTGCVGLPEDGPVVEADLGRRQDAERAPDIDARPPLEGSSRQAVVSGFLDAMTAWPIQTNVAKQYLAADAADAWNPDAGMIIYSDVALPEEVGGTVTVPLASADRLDASGGWRGALGPDARNLQFRLTPEDGEFRIVDPPDALVVPASWFQQRFRQVSLYYFDPIAQILVPEPVFVPVGEQLATSLVSKLLEEPPPRLRGIVRSFVPPGLAVELSVPVDDDGVAEITLTGEAPTPSADESELMLAQLAWTLRQDPDITALRVTVGGERLPLPGGAQEYEVDDARDFDPAGAEAGTQLYGLRHGRVFAGTPTNLQAVSGPFGTGRTRLAEVAVAPGPDLAAGVTADRSQVLVAPVRAGDGDERARFVAGGTSFARPTWDYVGRLWMVDRTARGARILCAEGGEPSRTRAVRVPGITGADVRTMLVSRDGTRLVAIVRGTGGDRLVAARVEIGPTGRVERATPAVVFSSAENLPRIVDIAWTSPTTLAVLTPTRPGSLFEVDSVVADGASVGVDTSSTIVSGRIGGVAGSADERVPTYAVLATDVVDVDTRETTDFERRVQNLDYAG